MRPPSASLFRFLRLVAAHHNRSHHCSVNFAFDFWRYFFVAQYPLETHSLLPRILPTLSHAVSGASTSLPQIVIDANPRRLTSGVSGITTAPILLAFADPEVGVCQRCHSKFQHRIERFFRFRNKRTHKEHHQRRAVHHQRLAKKVYLNFIDNLNHTQRHLFIPGGPTARGNHRFSRRVYQRW